MADVYARSSNRPGVVEFPAGAGPLYGLAAVAESNESGVPVIAITSDNPLEVEGRGFITELDCKRLFESTTKASILVTSAAKIPETIRRAFRIATTGRPGAVQITIPENVYHEDVDLRQVSLHVEEQCMSCPAYPVRGSRSEVEAVLGLLGESRRPLLIAGGGVNRSGGGEALTRFAEAFDLPVVTTMTGQQSIPDLHELSIGVAGDNGFHPHALRGMEEADLLIYVGCRMGSVITMSWTFPAPRSDRKIVQVDINPHVLGNASENALNVASDCRLFLEDMLEAADGSKSNCRDPAWTTTLNRWRQLFWDDARRQEHELIASNALKPLLIFKMLDERLRGEHLIIADPGTPTPYACRFLKLRHPDSRIIMNRAFGGLGYAIPGVVGAWFANPNQRPLGLFGDGSLGMSAGDLETITRLRIPAILLHFNNSGFGWIEAHQKLGGHHDSIPLHFSHVNCSMLAQAYGFKAFTVTSPDELETALDTAFDHEGPVFLDIPVESVADEIPNVYRWLEKAGQSPLEVGGKTLNL